MKTIVLINKNSSENPQFKQILFDKLIKFKIFYKQRD